MDGIFLVNLYILKKTNGLKWGTYNVLMKSFVIVNECYEFYRWQEKKGVNYSFYIFNFNIYFLRYF